MKSLLTAVSSRRAGWDYVRRLLAACRCDGTGAATTPVAPAPRGSQGLVEPLSERELDVLRLLATDLDGPDIARRLVRIVEHHAHPHQEHLRQARGEQPTGSGQSGRRAGPPVTQAATADLITVGADVGAEATPIAH